MSSESRQPWLAIVVLVATVAGLLAVAGGFAAITGYYSLPWLPGGLTRLVGLLAGILAALVIVAWFSRLPIIPTAAVVAVGGLTLLGALWPAAVVCAMALAFVLAGRRLRAWWRDRADDSDRLLFDVAIGAGAYGTLISVLAHFPVNHVALYTVLLAAPIAVDRREALALLRALVARFRPGASLAPLSAWVAVTLALAYLVVALFPETGWDALAMHLFIPGQVAAHGSWSFDPHRFSWALMPALGDWLFTLAYFFDGERGARLLNAASAILVGVCTYRIAVVCGARAGWAWFASALMLATPVMFAVGASLFIDATWTLFVLAALLALLRAPVPGQPPHAWVTCGALLGFSAAIKAVTMPFLPLIAIFVLAHWRTWRVRGGARVMAWSAVAFVLAACKPYLFSWLATGNPVYPFFIHLFGGSPPFDSWNTGPQTFRQPLTFTTPYDATFASNRYIEGRLGAPGFQWLILLPAAALALILSWHRRGLVLLALGLGMVAAVFAFQGYLRYVLPALALLIAAVAVAGTVLHGTRWARRAFAAAGVVVLALNVAHLNAASTQDAFPLRAVVDDAFRRDHLLRTLPVLHATEVAIRLPAGASRLAFFSSPAFALTGGAQVLQPTWYTPAFARAVASASTPESLARTLLDWQVRYVVIDSWWSQPESRRLVLGATTLLADFNGAAVREVRRDLMFEHEYLRNPDFASTEGWSLLGTARHDGAQQALIVTVDSPAFQSVPVKPGTAYLNKVRARCGTDGGARVQVNWLDARNAFLATSLQAFPCSGGWIEKEQEVVAPAGARIAVIYATSADAYPVAIGAVSFRGRRP